jgi:hypothetical protein
MLHVVFQNRENRGKSNGDFFFQLMSTSKALSGFRSRREQILDLFRPLCFIFELFDV